jgi:hypothetical protein
MTVIQGCFPHGLPHAANRTQAAQPFAAHATPSWVQARIGAHGAPKPVQRTVAAPRASQQPAHPNAVQLPRHIAPPPVHGGQPLPAQVRQKMEAAFGADFRDVRVHVGPQAQALGATAFTQGTNIHFAPGHYDPDTQRGQQMLGRELAHVVQQRSGRVRNPFGSGVAVVQDHMLEAEAERMAMRAAAVQPIQRKAAGNIVQRAAASVSGGGAGAGGGGGGKEFKFNPNVAEFVFTPAPKPKPKGPTITKAINYIGNAADYEPCKSILEGRFAGRDIHLEITNGLHSSFYGDVDGGGPGMYEYFDYIVSGNAVTKYHHYTRKLM